MLLDIGSSVDNVEIYLNIVTLLYNLRR